MTTGDAVNKVEFSPRQWSVRIYGSHPTDYEASCQIFRYGDRAQMYSIIGEKFYAAAGSILAWCEDQGIKSLEGYVSKAHARLLRMVLRGNADWRLEDQGSGRFDGHELTWVVVERGD